MLCAVPLSVSVMMWNGDKKERKVGGDSEMREKARIFLISINTN